MQETTIRIDDSREVYAERLELCVLRSAAFDAERPELTDCGFFAEAFDLLEQKRTGEPAPKEPAAPEETSHKAGCEGQTKRENGELCQPEELCRLAGFWMEELAGIPALTEGGCIEDLVIAWETTLQLLFEAESALAEQRQITGKEFRDILYSYSYDYAEEFLLRDREAAKAGRNVPRRFVTELAEAAANGTADRLSPHARRGVLLFFGDRMKARILEAMEKSGEKQTGSAVGKETEAEGKKTFQSPAAEGVEAPQPVAEIPGLSAHQKKSLSELFAKAALLFAVALLLFSLSACGKKDREEETEEAPTEAEYSYPGTVYYESEDGSIRDRFGVMHATVLDVQDGERDGLYVYTLRDEQDPDNIWCLYSQEIGSIVAEMNGGKKVAVLFSGDIVNDPDGLEFIAILNDAPYAIKKAEGTTVANMMTSFTVRTGKGVELNFIKDNCKVDRDALSTDNSSRVLIFYADCGGDKYPVRVYKSADLRHS